jgi:hypothetical protein
MTRFWFCVLLILPLAVHAAGRGKESWERFDSEFDNEKPWEEIERQLPAAPKPETLLPFFVSAATDNRFFVDGPSIGIGPDGVVRYALLIKSPSGSANLTFEGMRCTSRERKLYAIGRADGSWARARNPRWEPIRYEALNRPHHVLFEDFFCPDGKPVPTPEKAIEALRREQLR